MPLGLQRPREPSQQFGYVACDPRSLLGGIERMRLLPDAAKPVAQLRIPQVGQVDPEGLAVRELSVVLAGAGEVRVEVEAEADIADDQKWRIALGRGQVARVAFGLAPRGQHGARPSGRVTDMSSAFHLGSAEPSVLARVGALFGLQDETVPTIKVDPPRRGGAIRRVVGDSALEPIGSIRAASAVRALHAQHVA